jgi:toxin ParE1/3/4
MGGSKGGAVGSREVTRRIIFTPKARLDITEATDWHQQLGLASDFLRSVDVALDTIQERPFLYQIVERGVRRVPLKRFQYGLMYYVGDSEIIILTCFHDRRDPQFWRDLIP